MENPSQKKVIIETNDGKFTFYSYDECRENIKNIRKINGCHLKGSGWNIDSAFNVDTWNTVFLDVKSRFWKESGLYRPFTINGIESGQYPENHFSEWIKFWLSINGYEPIESAGRWEAHKIKWAYIFIRVNGEVDMNLLFNRLTMEHFTKNNTYCSR